MKSGEKTTKSREKIITMLSKDNTPSAAAFAEQRCRKADSRTECRQSDKAHRTEQGRILASSRKNRLIFLEGAQFAACLFLCVSKNIPPVEFQESIRTGSNLLTVCCFSFVFLFRLFRRSLVSAAVGVHCTDVKGKKFSGRIRSEGGRFCPKRPAARLFHFQ